MSQLILRGDAPTKAKAIEAYFQDFSSGDLVSVTISGTAKSIEYRASSSSDAASGLATLINASKIPEFQEVSASADGETLTLTAKTAGKPFFVDFSTEESSAVNVSVTETTKGEEPQNEVQHLTIGGSPTGGTWTYTNNFGSGDETTSAMAHDITAAELQAELESLASVSSGDVVVSGSALDFFLTWQGTYAETEVAEGSVDATSLTGGTAGSNLVKTVDGRGASDEIQGIRVSITDNTISSFSYSLTYGGQTASIDQDDDSAAIQAKLEALSSIGSGNIEVYGTQRPNLISGSFYLFLRFKGDLGETNLAQVNFTAGSNTIKDSLTQFTVQAGGQSTQNEHTHINIGDPSSGSYTIEVDGQETSSITVTSLVGAATLESYLEALSTVDDVEVYGDQFSAMIVWQGTDADTAVDSPTVNSSLTGGSVSVSQVVRGDGQRNEAYELYVNASSGTFTLSDGTDTTSGIAWNASAATVKTRLETDISAITTVSVSGSGTEADPWVIEVTSPGNTNIDDLSADGSSLGGSGGTISEVTGHSGGVNEVQTITVDAGVTGGTWEGSALGVPVGPFAYDESAAVIEDELQAIYGVSSVTVTGSDGGPYTVTFAGDYAETDVPAIEVDGSNLESASGSESVTVTMAQESRGPAHANDPANWVGGRVPETGDSVLLEDGTADLLYGLNWLTTFTADATSDRLSISQCDFADGQKVRVKSSGALPAGLSAATDYYVRLISDTEIKLSTSRGGSPVDITDAGTGTHTIQVELLAYTKSSVHTGKIGLPKRNTDGETYYEYRNRALRFAISSSGDKKITVGNGEGPGSGRHIIHTGDSEIDMVIYKTGGSDEPGVPAFQHTGENSNSLVIVHEAECGFAFDAGSSSQYRKITQHGGIVTLGEGETHSDYLKTDGELLANEANFTGTLTIVG